MSRTTCRGLLAKGIFLSLRKHKTTGRLWTKSWLGGKTRKELVKVDFLFNRNLKILPELFIFSLAELPFN